MWRSVPFTASSLSLLLLLGLVPLPIHAQASQTFVSGTRIGVGYTAAVPEALIGAGAFMFFGQSRIGAFADWKITIPSVTRDDIYCPDILGACTVDFVLAERNDQEIQVFDEWLIFNGGLMYAVTPELAFLAGAGIARQNRYREFYDDEIDANRITASGGYYVDDDDASGWVGQFVGGILFRAGPRLAFRFGYETAPGGMSIGGYFVR